MWPDLLIELPQHILDGHVGRHLCDRDVEGLLQLPRHHHTHVGPPHVLLQLMSQQLHRPLAVLVQVERHRGHVRATVGPPAVDGAADLTKSHRHTVLAPLMVVEERPDGLGLLVAVAAEVQQPDVDVGLLVRDAAMLSQVVDRPLVGCDKARVHVVGFEAVADGEAPQPRVLALKRTLAHRWKGLREATARCVNSVPQAACPLLRPAFVYARAVDDGHTWRRGDVLELLSASQGMQHRVVGDSMLRQIVQCLWIKVEQHPCSGQEQQHCPSHHMEGSHC
mmetsp:Transcript_34043/g.84175  ORF Transcript_34043/g.84175 Transcript_34043/m.84175 type:complete len:279 (-) Transcript_34043:235-1071(-)